MIIFLIITSLGRAQIKLTDNEIFCNQYVRIINLVINDDYCKDKLGLKHLKVNVNSEVRYGIGSPFMTRFYVANQLGVDIEDLNLRDSIYIRLASKVEQEENENISLKDSSVCLRNFQFKNPNVLLRFARKSDKIVFINVIRLFDDPRHSQGVFYLVYFTVENEISKIFRNPWIN